MERSALRVRISERNESIAEFEQKFYASGKIGNQ